jgi:HlyD family secretion protein
MKTRRIISYALWTGIGLAAIAAFAWAMRPQPVQVETATVSRGALSATVSGEGRTRVKDLYVIAAPVDGQLERVSVQPTEPVARDAVVARILPVAPRPLDARTRAEARAAVKVARAVVARAEASEKEARVAVDHADSALARSQRLARASATPAAEAEHADHESQLRHRALDAARAATRAARADLARATALVAPAKGPGDAAVDVRSPVTGQILRVRSESAGPIAAGTPLVEVGDIHYLEVTVDLLSSDAALVRPDARATITGWGGPAPLAARVRRVDVAAFTKVSALGLEEQRARVVLDLTDPPPEGLGHDYRVDVAIVTWTGADVLRVPATALFRADDRWAVFAARDGRARLTLVQLGATDGTWTVVEHGLSAGDQVVVQPSDDIRDGTRIR